MGEAKIVNKIVQEIQIENTAISLTTEQLVIVDKFFEARNSVNEMTKKQKALEAQVKEILGDAEVGIANGKIRIEQAFRARSGIDSKMLKTVFPEAFEACKTSSNFVVLVAK